MRAVPVGGRASKRAGRQAGGRAGEPASGDVRGRPAAAASPGATQPSRALTSHGAAGGDRVLGLSLAALVALLAPLEVEVLAGGADPVACGQRRLVGSEGVAGPYACGAAGVPAGQPARGAQGRSPRNGSRLQAGAGAAAGTAAGVTAAAAAAAGPTAGGRRQRGRTRLGGDVLLDLAAAQHGRVRGASDAALVALRAPAKAAGAREGVWGG